MILKKEPDINGNRLESEGKILQIMPIIRDPYGIPYALPPARYVCPNWLLGFLNQHIIGYPIVYNFNQYWRIPGSTSSMDSQLTMVVSIEEHSPEMIPQPVTVDAESVRALLEGLGMHDPRKGGESEQG